MAELTLVLHRLSVVGNVTNTDILFELIVRGFKMDRMTAGHVLLVSIHVSMRFSQNSCGYSGQERGFQRRQRQIEQKQTNKSLLPDEDFPFR